MKKIQCEVCGSNNIKKINDDVFECQGCGVHYSKNDVQNMLTEASEPEIKIVEPEIEKPKDAVSALKLADEAFNSGSFVKAYAYYNAYLLFESNNPYVLFMSGLSRVWQSSLIKEYSDEVLASARKAVELTKSNKINENDFYEFMVWMAEKMTDFALSYHRSAIIDYKEHMGQKSLVEDTWKRLIVSLNVLQFSSTLIDEKAIAQIVRAEKLQKRVSSQGNSIINQLLEKRDYKDQGAFRKLAPSVEVKKIADYYANYFDTCIFNLPSSAEERKRLADRENAKKSYWKEHPEEYKAHLERKKKAEAKKKKEKILNVLAVSTLVISAITFFATIHYYYYGDLEKYIHLGSAIYFLFAGSIYAVFWIKKYLLTMHDKK